MNKSTQSSLGVSPASSDLTEIARILARAYLRLRARHALPLAEGADSASAALEVPPEIDLTVPTGRPSRVSGWKPPNFNQGNGQ
jgi:hypothetical protein